MENFSRKMKTLKRKNTVSKMQNSLDELNDRHISQEKGISEPQDRSLEIIQTE